MRALAAFSAITGTISLILLLVIWLGTPEWRGQVPIEVGDDDPLSVLAFLLPIIPASVALVAGIPVFKRPSAKLGLALGCLTWAGAALIMGPDGLKTLF